MTSIKQFKLAAISLTSLCLAPLSCLAQAEQAALYEVVHAVAKPGMTSKLEEVMYGPDEGNLEILIPFKWENEDNPPSYEAGLGQSIARNFEPYVTSAHTQLVRQMPNLGNRPANATPSKYYELLNLKIRPARMDAFLAAVGQLSTAEQKFNPSPNPVLVYTTVAGGDADAVAIAIGHPNFADFGHQQKSATEVLTSAYGAPAAHAILDALDETIANEQVTILKYRPELSFTPGGQR
jgi:hypothetical protein